jgi:hypothetical protein
MATIEGLFNFDEKLLAREVVKNRENAAIGQAKGWGPMMMGMNKIGQAIFNSDDKILKEQTIAQTSLKETMDILGPEAQDSTKLYDVLGKRLIENGASAETLMKLKSVASNQANDKANIDTANALRQSTYDLQVAKFEETKRNKAEGVRKDRLKEFNKTISDEDHPAAWLYKEALGQIAGGDSAAHKEGALEFNSMVQKYVVDSGLSISDSIKAAKEEFGQKYKIKPDDSWWWFQDDNSKLQRRDGSDSTAINPKAQGALDYYDNKGK